eukprot:CAMPEP_0194250256 /NCGR_PEP_ID=MMETSP0158-20130606/22556_1 /TAXON_ID=33649 /ORGANISM="Thalassionema nitzschioides, Strain L26-B" /LENGTH=197 /DNA_ID=CAMNT_0038986993 /DNA_START=83 /DNA_END=672 /DNA_ORIENTATION=+
MITFVPYPNFDNVAKCLDDKRLGAQRYEAWSILKWLRNPTEYPKLVKAGYCCMWRGYEDALIQYINAMLVEWAARGKTNNLLKPFDPVRKLNTSNDSTPPMPPWLGHPTLQSCHRHALISKFPQHYGQFGWFEDGSAYTGSYLWPDQTEQGDWVLRWPKSVNLKPISLEVVAGNQNMTRKKQLRKREVKQQEDSKNA